MLNELRRRQLASTREGEQRNVAGVYPAVNIYDDGDAFMIRAELPGLVKSKLDIVTKGNRVSIAGERTCAPQSDDDSFHRRERDMGYFRRIVVLPEQIDPAKTTASYVNGVLEVVCARASTAKAHRVEIA
jgi:HSP20 family protein